MLKTKKVKWTKRDDLASKKQGWALFTQDNGSIALLGLGDPQGVADEHGFEYKGPAFTMDNRDAEALQYVKDQAKKGDLMCKKALTLLDDRKFEGEFETCAHRVEFWYSLEALEGRELTDEITGALTEEAEERAKICIIDGNVSGKLNCCYVFGDGNRPKEAEIRGWFMAATLKPDQCQLVAIDEIDAYPGPGAFLSLFPKEKYESFGITVEAFNHTHAQYLACKKLVEASGGEWCQCAVCHHNIRWLVLCQDEKTGKHYTLGRDCAATLVSGATTDAWDKKRKLRDIKEVTTKRGVRYVHGREVPQWFWDLPKSERPAFVSLGSYEKPSYGRGRSRPAQIKVWTLSVWGETVDEVLSNIDILDALEHAHKGG